MFALVLAGHGDEARAVANGIVEAAGSHPQPVCALVRAARLRGRLRDADPDRARKPCAKA